MGWVFVFREKAGQRRGFDPAVPGK